MSYFTLKISLSSRTKWLLSKPHIKTAIFRTVVCVVALILNSVAYGQTNAADEDAGTSLNAYNVSWNTPGPTPAQSMPLGNGDIGLNVWVEPDGDLVFYISKTDAWGGNVFGDEGALLKLGRVRISLSPNPLATNGFFSQVLKLHDGEIAIKEGSNANAIQLRVWADANHPVIRVEAASGQPISARVVLEDWRGLSQGDTVLPAQNNKVVWFHRNNSNVNPHVANLTFGALIRGDGLVSRDASTLESSTNVTSQLISIYPLTATTATPDEWLAQLNQQANEINRLDLEQTRWAHRKWWDQFWHRSWIYVRGDQEANEVTEGYILQRFVTACAGRGAYPIKFNGSIFVVDNPALVQDRKKPPQAVNADFRTWGGQYWFQNTRAMYWPRLEAGDFDEMLPLFKMYAGQLASNSVQVAGYYHHPGAYFAETAPFWGGLRYWGPEVKEDWTGHYFTPILELSMMMLDYYEYTGDKQFARDTLIPIATAGLQFFDKHFGRDAQGKILLDPDNAIEMYWKVHDPAPDIAGLKAVLSRMIALPDDLVDDSTRADWKKMLEQVPDLPMGIKDGKNVLLPYTGEQTARPRNGENPELYAVYPFRLYGLGHPDLQLAIDTFNERRCRQKGCWVQDPIQAAMLGMAEVAKDYVHYNLTRRDAQLKFPAFWERGNDYAPDEDNGGNGENGLQQMLMQSDGKKILLLPAWPKEWDVDFKLNAPGQTTVQGKYQHGRLIDLVVNPPQRMADVVDLSQSTASAKTAN
jgi:alpha-L-fucosidase 2